MKKTLFILLIILPALSWGQFGKISPNLGIYIPNLDRNTITGTDLTSGLIVFDINTKSIWYYKDSTIGWVEIPNSISGSGVSTSWQLNGNTLLGGEYLGSSNNQDIILKRNIVESIKISTGGSVTFTGNSLGVTPINGAGKRMMWIPAKGAFRVGEVYNTDWNEANIGNHSIGIGTSKASGDESVAIGLGSQATGFGSVALGAKHVSGSTANTIAQGAGSVSIGFAGKAEGIQSVAIGTNSLYWGSDFGSIARGQNSFSVGGLASGQFSTAIQGGQSLGTNSFSIGVNSKSIGDYSYSLGGGIASNEYSLAFLGKTNQPNSIAMGLGAITNARNSVAITAGSGATTTNYGSTVIGSFNDITTNPGNAINGSIGGGYVPNYPWFVIGNGYDDTHRANALTITQTGNMGIKNANPRSSLDITGTDAIIVPVGTTAQRSATPVIGMIRYNTTSLKYEGYTASGWVDFH